jgi:predicted dehydrogenase
MKNRRQFLGALAAPAAASAAGFPAVVPGAALGLNGAVAASERVTIATIGVGWMGGDHISEFLKIPEAQYIAVCDVDDEHLAEAKQKIDTKYGNRDCAAYHAFEELLFRRDLDAVSIAVPDHWHGIVAFSAARAGKDIYCEKPLAHNFAEGVMMREAARQYGRVWQTGSWQRSREHFRKACEFVRNQRVGKVRRVEVGLPAGHTDFAKTRELMAVTDPPATLNYDRWTGPASEMPYRVACVHKNWRWNLNTGGGQIMDWVGHHVDIAHWGLGFDETGPLEVEGVGEYPPRDAPWNTATRYKVTARYRDGIEMVIAGGYKEIRGGTRWIGDGGWVWVDRRAVETSPANLLTSEIASDELHLPVSPGHYQEFIDCVKRRGTTLTPAWLALRSATPGWLGQIAMLTGTRIRWDPENERILDNPAAEKLLSRNMRAPWRLG